MIEDISGLTLAEACDEKGAERVVQYVVDWCRYEADNLEEGRKSMAEIEDIESDKVKELDLRVLADKLAKAINYNA